MTIDIGSEWRKALDDLVARTVARTQTDTSNWAKAGRSTKDRPNGDDLDFWRKSGEQQLESYVKWLNETDWVFADIDGEPMIEFKVQAEFGGVPVKGVIDGCMVTPDGELGCLDWKTGSRTPESSMQLGLYASSLEVMGYPRPSFGAYFMTRKGLLTDRVSLDQYSVHYFNELFGMFRQAVEMEIFIPDVSGHCRTCSVRDACYAVGGTDAYIYDPMHPAYQPKQDTN